MKRLIPVIGILIGSLVAGRTRADFHFQEGVRHQSSVFGFVVRSRPGPVQELWVGGHREALTQSGYTLIVDVQKNWLCFVNHKTRTYVETSLPLDMASVISEEVEKRGLPSTTTGTVRDTGMRRRILDMDSHEYEVSIWRLDGDRSDRQRFKVWSTTEVPFDTTVVDVLVDNLRVLFGRDRVLRSELCNIRGIPMGLAYRGEGFLVRNGIVTEVHRMTEEDPLPGTYAPPEVYTCKDRLTPEDF